MTVDALAGLSRRARIVAWAAPLLGAGLVVGAAATAQRQPVGRDSGPDVIRGAVGTRRELGPIEAAPGAALLETLAPS